jgi:hypothetical protein
MAAGAGENHGGVNEHGSPRRENCVSPPLLLLLFS